MIRRLTSAASVDRRGRRIFELDCAHWTTGDVRHSEIRPGTAWCAECQSERAGKGHGVDSPGLRPCDIEVAA